jgi:hypothetical protein
MAETTEHKAASDPTHDRRVAFVPPPFVLDTFVYPRWVDELEVSGKRLRLVTERLDSHDCYVARVVGPSGKVRNVNTIPSSSTNTLAQAFHIHTLRLVMAVQEELAR